MTTAITDQSVADAVRRELEWDPRVNANSVGLTATDGSIVLRGAVSSRAEKLAAVQAAERVYGGENQDPGPHRRVRVPADVNRRTVHLGLGGALPALKARRNGRRGTPARRARRSSPRGSTGADCRRVDAVLRRAPVCLGASVHRRFDHVTSVDDAKMDELLHGLVQDIEGGYVHSLAVVVPAPVPWPLPAYEIALMASERAWDTQADMSVTVITPEDAPLALFGFEASLGMGRLLAERKIEIITSASCDIPKSGTIRIHPGDRTLEVDRIVALPELRGPAIVGLPHDSVGFIPIGEYAQVVGAERVWAAGDVAGYPIKHGGVSAQMADTAARSIAALAGAAVQPQTFDPSLEGVVLTGGTPRYLRRRAEGSDARQSEMLKLKRGDQTPKIAARYLAPQLAALAPLTPQHPETIEPVIAAR
jgi:hypothetical protein